MTHTEQVTEGSNFFYTTLGAALFICNHDGSVTVTVGADADRSGNRAAVLSLVLVVLETTAAVPCS